MIAFGTAIVDPEAYRRWARPGIRRAAEPDSEVVAINAVGANGRGANLLLDAAAAFEDLEALVLVDERTEITDPSLCSRLREAFADPGVAVVGSSGASGVRGIAWWDGRVSSGPVVHRYYEHGGGSIPAFGFAHPDPAGREVEVAAGFLMALSPWAVRNLRFDEGLHWGHGYDLDLCLQARAAGRKVLTAGLAAVRHVPLELFEDRDGWLQAHLDFAEKWDAVLSGETADWRARARRAEAEREAARTLAYSNRLLIDARVLDLERALERATSTPGWRLTAPLRRLNALRQRR